MQTKVKRIRDDYLGVKRVEIETIETQNGIWHTASFIDPCDKTKGCVSQGVTEQSAIDELINLCLMKKENS